MKKALCFCAILFLTSCASLVESIETSLEKAKDSFASQPKFEVGTYNACTANMEGGTKAQREAECLKSEQSFWKLGYYEFNADGKGTYALGHGGDHFSFTWKVDGQKVILDYGKKAKPQFETVEIIKTGFLSNEDGDVYISEKISP